MTADERIDLMLGHLRRGSLLDVSAPDASRVRRRCHAALRRRGRRGGRHEFAWQRSWRVLEPALVAALCAAYLSDVVRRAIALLGG